MNYSSETGFKPTGHNLTIGKVNEKEDINNDILKKIYKDINRMPEVSMGKVLSVGSRCVGVTPGEFIAFSTITAESKRFGDVFVLMDDQVYCIDIDGDGDSATIKSFL